MSAWVALLLSTSDGPRAWKPWMLLNIIPEGEQPPQQRRVSSVESEKASAGDLLFGIIKALVE